VNLLPWWTVIVRDGTHAMMFLNEQLALNRNDWDVMSRFIRVIVTTLVVCLTWAFGRSSSREFIHFRF